MHSAVSLASPALVLISYGDAVAKADPWFPAHRALPHTLLQMLPAPGEG